MKLLKFLLKYYLFRSTRSLAGIKQVIRSQGFKIHPFHPEETETHSAELLRLLGATEYARSKVSFIATNDITKACFIRRNLCEKDQLLLLWHEEAHIWLEHPHKTGYLQNTSVQKENEANLFLFKCRLLKAIIYFFFFLSIFVGIQIIK